MMSISPIVNSVKCTVLACLVQFWYVLEGSTVALQSSYCTYRSGNSGVMLFACI